jgi:uncharacterized protein (DUF58 family)
MNTQTHMASVEDQAEETLDFYMPHSIRLKVKRLSQVFSLGVNPTSKRGTAGYDFYGYRSYVKGDYPRLLDPRKSLKENRPIVKEYFRESDISWNIILDISGSMRYPIGKNEPTKLAHAKSVAATLARLMMEHGIYPVFTALGAPVHKSRMATRHFSTLCQWLQKLTPVSSYEQEPILMQLQQIAHSRKKQLRHLFLSDFTLLHPQLHHAIQSISSTFGDLTGVCVTHPDEESFNFSGPIEMHDIESGARVSLDASTTKKAYLRERAHQLEQWQQTLGRMVHVRTTDPGWFSTLRVVEALHDVCLPAWVSQPGPGRASGVGPPYLASPCKKSVVPRVPVDALRTCGAGAHTTTA